MKDIVHRSGSQISDLLDWFQKSTPFGLRAFGLVLRLEDYVENDTYVLRAELPGIDPQKDVKVEVKDGSLTIRGARHETKHDKLHREILYGTFSRTVPLARGANVDDIRAAYSNGVLEVRVPHPTDVQRKKRIPIESSTEMSSAVQVDDASASAEQ